MELAAASSKRMPLLLLLLAAIVGLGQCYHYAPITQKSPVWPFSAGDFDRRHDLLDFDDDDDDDDDRIDDYIAPFPPMSRFPRRHRLETVFQWSYLDWVRGAVERTGKNFTLGNPLTQDVDIDARGRVFVTSPQWLEGTPVTLSLVTNQNGPGGPLLTPYPDWTWHRADADCDSSIVSVYRVAIDECDRLWMVDTGSASGKAVCPAKILVFDLKRDELLLRYQIPAGQTVNNEASYVNPIVEVGKSCQDTYLYVADVLKHGILVYDMRLNRSWRLNNTASNAFGNDPEAGRITIEGESIDLTDGTLGMTLTPRGLFPKRYLYFNSLASFYQKVLEADSLKRSFVYEPIMYRSLAKRQSQAGVQAISKNGITFFQLAEYTALACWNVRQPFKPENIVVVARIPRLLQYISGMKVLVNAQGHEELWFNTNRLQKTINNSRKINEINFRLIRGSVDDLVAGTRCQQNDASGAEFREQDWQRI